MTRNSEGSNQSEQAASSGARDAAEASIDAARAWEPVIKAWAYLPEQPQAAQLDGPLGGVPFAVKDVIDVAGMPTRCGWDAFENRPPARADAAVVAALRTAGAVPVGKTRSTAFAFVDPTITCNPYAPGHSPGGSSSGSGAAVGAGLVPFALGTQTAGSLCRPALYCGAFAYKPSLGLLPTDGMTPLSASFDAVGVIAGSFDWLERVFAVLADAFALPPASRHPANLRIGMVDVPEQCPDSAMKAVMLDVIERLRAAGHQVEKVQPSVSFADIIERHRVIMLKEAARDLLPLIGAQRALLPPKIAQGLRDGEDIAEDCRAAALRFIEEARALFWEGVGGFDLLAGYAVPGVAPAGLGATGDQSYLTPWTALGGPLVALPAGIDPAGLPMGILLASPPGTDSQLMAQSRQVAQVLPAIPRPRISN